MEITSIYLKTHRLVWNCNKISLHLKTAFYLKICNFQNDSQHQDLMLCLLQPLFCWMISLQEYKVLRFMHVFFRGYSFSHKKPNDYSYCFLNLWIESIQMSKITYNFSKISHARLKWNQIHDQIKKNNTNIYVILIQFIGI